MDDNRELVGLLDEFISSQEDMEVVGTAHNGQDCLQLLEDVSPDVLILDIIMPHLDGLGVLERLRQSETLSFPSVIMLTAFGQEDVTTKAVELGASYFILKPFDMEHLANHIRQVSGKGTMTNRKHTPHKTSDEKSLAIWKRILHQLFMRLAFRHILKAICIYGKRFQWFITILNYLVLLLKCFIQTLPRNLIQQQVE